MKIIVPPRPEAEVVTPVEGSATAVQVLDGVRQWEESCVNHLCGCNCSC